MQSLPALRLDHTTQTLLLTTYFMTNLSRICTLLECLRTANPMSENNYLNMLNIIIVLALAQYSTAESFLPMTTALAKSTTLQARNELWTEK